MLPKTYGSRFANLKSLDLQRSSRTLVYLHDDAAQSDIRGRGLITNGQPSNKPSDHKLRLHSDDAVVRAGHSKVGYVGGAFGQNALVGRLNVSVRADDDRDPAVEVSSKRLLLGSGFGVMIHDHDFGAPRDLFEYPVHSS